MTTKQQTYGGAWLAGQDSYAAIADRIGRSKTLVGYWVSGSATQGDADIELIAAAYGIPATAWTEPAREPASASTPSPSTDEETDDVDDAVALAAWKERLYRRRPGAKPKLAWLGRLALRGYDATAHTNGENARTAEKIGDDLAAYPDLIAVVLVALKPYA